MLVAVPHAINATLHAKSNVHVATDIDPVAGIYSSAFVMLVNPAMPIGTVAEFIAYAKANPGKLNMTSSGAGNLSHLSGELFRMMTGVEMVHVPYKGTVPALAGLMAGDVHVMFDSLTSAMPHLQSGRLRGLAVTTTTRLAALPDIPTVAETVPGYVVNGWLGLGAPKGTPSEIIDRLNRETNAVLADPVIKARLAQVGGTALAGSPADFGRHVADATERWGRVIKFANIKSD
jgi:tripartite-type tricarboxylate transporter receptor subunit TctC